MLSISGVGHQITSVVRKEYVLIGSLGIGFAAGGWVGALGTGAAYFAGKKIYQNCHCSRAVQNIYSGLFGSSQSQTVAAPKVVSQTEIQKINDDLYIAQRAQDRDLTFAMVRLTDENLSVWWDLHQKDDFLSRDEVAKLWDEKWNNEQKRFIFKDISGGAMAFRHTLYMYEESRDKPIRPEVWISYVLSGANIDPKQPMRKELFPHVEMALTVLTHPDAPMVLHMGIGRTIYNTKKIYDGALPQHKGLSVTIHAFTAKAILGTSHGRNKVWMATRPTFNMAEILDKNLPVGSFVSGEENQPIFYNADRSLTIKNPEGQILSNFTKEDFINGRMAFYQHPEMFQPLQSYAVQYQTLAGIF